MSDSRYSIDEISRCYTRYVSMENLRQLFERVVNGKKLLIGYNEKKLLRFEMASLPSSRFIIISFVVLAYSLISLNVTFSKATRETS